jgi:hypothetical protein
VSGCCNQRLNGVLRLPPEVRFEIPERDLSAYRRAADFLNLSNADVLCVQHELGIFGGQAGNHLLATLNVARMPGRHDSAHGSQRAERRSTSRD